MNHVSYDFGSLFKYWVNYSKVIKFKSVELCNLFNNLF